MKFFTISRIRQAIGHLNSFKSGWVIGPLVVTSVNVVEKAGGLEVATGQAALGGSCRVSLV
ncbi:hypothetical protein, partial [Neoroseomonas alkaliterrae]|uniref:hypothetical protein n=1 Tax=Neoroseomonas alkaliterrae TaxID=1452450 RepID=UPI001C84977F